MNLRTLGTIAMISAPAMLISVIIAPNGDNHVAMGIASLVFMAGWLASNLGMQKMQALGTGLWAKIVLRVQMVGILLAAIFGILEATQIVPDDNIFFIVTDLCWPLSMLFMIVVGIMTIRANRWAGWQRFVPLICALWLPVAMAIGIAGGENLSMQQLSVYVGFSWTTIAWFVLALIVRSNATLALPKNEMLASASQPAQ